ncbi:nuclear transport factor 2 isoform X1 [Lactuca sativa]|uniref:nuclear transport factor 2 isoform X1 n=1 Tax=Lactuca sativa TaxID=4236 RepID=UPI000CD8CA44|nr:nuclear transport factor 2 isoform X1 [Lactuca sativa]
MATPFHFPLTAAQVGHYFVGHYYQVLQTQPDVVHQFYSERSTLLRVDGDARVTGTSMLEIHSIVMSLNYTGVEIKTLHSLESWDNGVLVLASGSVHQKDFNSRTFVQTFFLAPQEKGFFVLNDIFHYIDDQPIHHHHPVAYLSQNNLLSKLNAPTALQEQASNYMGVGDIQGRDFVTPTTTAVENGSVNNYSFQKQQLQAPEVENSLEDNYPVKSNGSVNALQDRLTSVEEPVGEPQKHTYASILQVAKGQSAPPSAPREQQPVTKSPTPFELNHVEPTSQRSGVEAVEDSSGVEDEVVELKSVYVKNVPTNAIASDIEEEFKKFGKIRQDGVAIRTRKDIDVCYAFVEFEDMSGVHNAIKASTVEISGQQVFIEGRRANRSNNAYRGGRGRGRGRSGYQMDGRGRFGGRNYARMNGQDPRSNGYYRHTYSRNGHSPSD